MFEFDIHIIPIMHIYLYDDDEDLQDLYDEAADATKALEAI